MREALVVTRADAAQNRLGSICSSRKGHVTQATLDEARPSQILSLYISSTQGEPSPSSPLNGYKCCLPSLVEMSTPCFSQISQIFQLPEASDRRIIRVAWELLMWEGS